MKGLAKVCDGKSAATVSEHRVELVELESLVYDLLIRDVELFG